MRRGTTAAHHHKSRKTSETKAEGKQERWEDRKKDGRTTAQRGWNDDGGNAKRSRKRIHLRRKRRKARR